MIVLFDALLQVSYWKCIMLYCVFENTKSRVRLYSCGITQWNCEMCYMNVGCLFLLSRVHSYVNIVHFSISRKYFADQLPLVFVINSWTISSHYFLVQQPISYQLKSCRLSRCCPQTHSGLLWCIMHHLLEVNFLNLGPLFSLIVLSMHWPLRDYYLNVTC